MLIGVRLISLTQKPMVFSNNARKPLKAASANYVLPYHGDSLERQG